MKLVTIKNAQNVITHQAKMPDPTQWIAEQVASNSWGKPDRWIKEGFELPSDLLSGEVREVIDSDGVASNELFAIADYSVEISDITAETALNSLREKRDKLLASSDFTQMIDSPLSAEKKAEWASYRQTLRDLPESTVDLENPIWPVKPT